MKIQFYFTNNWKTINLVPDIIIDLDENSIEDDNKLELAIAWLGWQFTVGIKK